jgi:hypothetical protein
MVKLQIGNSTFICDTAEEAVRIHRLAGGGNGIAAPSPASGSHVARQPASTGRTKVLLKKLGPHVGKDLTSEELAKIVGAKTLGLGPMMHQLRRNLAKDGIEMDDFILKVKPDPDSPASWKILKVAA